MKIGLVGYANNQGLGIMSQDFIRYLNIIYQLVIPSSDKGTNYSLAAKHYLPAKDFCPTDKEINNFLDIVDCVFCVEATYSPNLFEIAKRRKKRTVFFPMWEWFRNEDARYMFVDLFFCTSNKCFNEVHFKNKVFAPWPVDDEYFPYREITGPAKTFLHNAGFAGLNGRKGTNETVEAFTRLNGDYRLIINTQKPIKEYGCAKLIFSDSRITVNEKNFTEKADLYKDGDVLVAPHHCDGQFLVGEEGMACGMPVITTNAEPMAEFGNEELLVKVKKFIYGGFIHENAGHNIPDVDDLYSKMKWCTENDLSILSSKNRKKIVRDYSWNNLSGLYLKLLRGDPA